VTLDRAPAGAEITVVRVQAEPALGRRLAELGIRRGQQVMPLHRTAGGGRLVAVGDTRIALACSFLAGIEVEPA
jgi:Fe2+ transport system protein FeoA